MRFDPYDMGYVIDPHPTYEWLRDHAPAFFWPDGKAWVFSRYEDVQLVLGDPRVTRFPVEPTQVSEPYLGMALDIARKTIAVQDRENHARLRKVLAPWFSPAGVQRQAERIREIVDKILNDLDGETVDLVTQVADRLPCLVLRSMLGLDTIGERAIRRFGDMAQLGSASSDAKTQRDEAMKPCAQTMRLLRETIDERRRHARPDLISALVIAEEDGELRADEVMPQLMAILLSGTETTASFVTWAMLELIRHPEAMALVRREPQLLPGALEEAMRHENIGKLSHPCFARESMTVRGVELQRGECVFTLIGSAQRDPEVFEDPEKFDIRRDLTRSASFGAGAHLCIGAHLARLEVRLCVGALIERFPRIELAGVPHFTPHPTLRRIDSMPVRLGRPS